MRLPAACTVHHHSQCGCSSLSAGLLLCAISLTEGFASDGTSSQVIKADATTSAASIGLGRQRRVERAAGL